MEVTSDFSSDFLKLLSLLNETRVLQGYLLANNAELLHSFKELWIAYRRRFPAVCLYVIANMRYPFAENLQLFE